MKVLIIVGIVLLSLTLVAFNRKQPSNDLIKTRTGWIDFADANGLTIFQGYILGGIKDANTLALIGVLLEKNCDHRLVSAIKEHNPTYIEGGKILVKCLTAPDQELWLTDFSGNDLKQKIEPYVSSNEEIKTKLVLGSRYIDHIDNEEGIRDFDKYWNSEKVIPKD